jgi:hypothetical protein
MPEDSVFSQREFVLNGMKLIEVDEGAHRGTSGISLHLFDASSNHKKRAWELPYLWNDFGQK